MKRVARFLLIATGSLALLSLLLVVGLIVAMVVPGDPGPIERAAGALEPRPGWVVTQTSTEPPRLICAGDVTCPSLLTLWDIPAQLSVAEFEVLVAEAGWGFPVTGDCEPNANISGGQTLCKARGDQGGFDITVSQRITPEGGPQIRLYLEKSR